MVAFKAPFRHPFSPPFCFSGIPFPPIASKLLTWFPGEVKDGYRVDKVNGYNFLITPGVDPITAEWDGADATYSFASVGSPVPAEINTQDQVEGRFWTDSSGNALGKTQAEWEAYVIAKAANFMRDCPSETKEISMYTEILEGAELAKVQIYNCLEPPSLSFDEARNSMYIPLL